MYWDWRVEKGANVLFGSSNTSPEIDNNLQLLKGKTIEYIRIAGDVKEIEVGLSNNLILESMIMTNYDPQWGIRTIDEQYVCTKGGKLYIGDGANSEYAEEWEQEVDITEETTKRWGIPSDVDKKGDCQNCKYFRRINGDAYFLDYGVCIYKGSKFDGLVVNVRSGCTHFLSL